MLNYIASTDFHFSFFLPFINCYQCWHTVSLSFWSSVRWKLTRRFSFFWTPSFVSLSICIQFHFVLNGVQIFFLSPNGQFCSSRTLCNVGYIYLHPLQQDALSVWPGRCYKRTYNIDMSLIVHLSSNISFNRKESLWVAKLYPSLFLSQEKFRSQEQPHSKDDGDADVPCPTWVSCITNSCYTMGTI